MIAVRHEVWPFIGAAVVAGLLLLGIGRLCALPWAAARWSAVVFSAVMSLYFLYFFRNPPRTPPPDPTAVIAGADGVIARITTLSPQTFRELAQNAGLDPTRLERLSGGDCIRISIFLSLFDVHVNRAPISGTSSFLGYFPGKHYFTFDEKSSDHNQHNSILIVNSDTACLFNQIVGPVCRRVVYWPDHDKPVAVQAGDPIGMMKFGSRLDMVFPATSLVVEVKEGDRVRAGETVIAHIRKETAQ